MVKRITLVGVVAFTVFVFLAAMDCGVSLGAAAIFPLAYLTGIASILATLDEIKKRIGIE
jgi:hypothetical protein